MNYNKVILVGNVVSVPVIFERNGKYLISFVMATSSKIKDEYGANSKESDFHDITHSTNSREYAYGLKQDDKVFIEGELKNKKRNNGQHKNKVKAYNMQYEKP